MITLNHADHTYFNDQNPNVKYISVTTLIGKYHEEFDKIYHAARVAERKGMSMEAVLQEWQEENDRANNYGTYVHEILERFLLAPNNMYSPRDDFERVVIAAFKRLCLDNGLTLIGNNGTIPEKVLSIEFNGLLGVAGTSDIVENIEDDMFNIWDHKTNKRFDFEDKYRKWLYFPINHLSDCHYNKYGIQLSTYALMYERESGKKLNRMGVFYWDKIVEQFQLIPIPYMKKEAELLIEHYKHKLNV